jgi:hypothetical protein
VSDDQAFERDRVALRGWSDKQVQAGLDAIEDDRHDRVRVQPGRGVPAAVFMQAVVMEGLDRGFLVVNKDPANPIQDGQISRRRART